MSEYRSSSTKLTTKEKAMGKENVFISKQLNKLAGTNSQKIVPRRRFLSADLERGGPCNCSAVVSNNNVAFNDQRSLAKRTPFRIHVDQASNDFGKGARFRERIVEYDTRRVEELKRHSRVLQNKINKKNEPTSQHRVSSTNKQQPEVNSGQDLSQNLKERKACHSVIAGSHSIITSIKTISGVKLQRPPISTAKSLVDLSKVNKPSTPSNKFRDTIKRNREASAHISRNLALKRSVSSQSINKLNNLADPCNRVNLRSRSCSNQRSVVILKEKETSTGSANKAFVIVKKQEIGSDKCKKLDEGKDLLISLPLIVVSNELSEKQIAGIAEDYQIRENTKALHGSNHKVTSISGEQNLNDQKEQPLADAISQKVQEKVESDLQVVQQNTDFSAYLLYNSEYLVDLLTIEMEKDISSPKLSSEFIENYINSESRNIVVAFLIRLSTHRRYPSFILYQAVKIFDATIDRISIEETDMQVAAVTALWIVLKKDGNFNKIPSAKTLLEIAQIRETDNKNILAEWERLILRVLDFNITFSDPFSIFVFYVINYNHDSRTSNSIMTTIYYCGGYVIDLALLDVKLSYTTSNLLALTTAELVVTIILDDEANLSPPRWHYWRNILTNSVYVPIRYYDSEINLLRGTLISHILESAKKHTKQGEVRKRYERSRYGNISNLFLNKIKKLSQEEYSIRL